MVTGPKDPHRRVRREASIRTERHRSATKCGWANGRDAGAARHIRVARRVVGASLQPRLTLVSAVVVSAWPARPRHMHGVTSAEQQQHNTAQRRESEDKRERMQIQRLVVP